MTGTDTYSGRRFYRDADRAVLGGVFAGIAGYLGFNLCVTRFLAVVLLFMTGPFLVIAYFAAVILTPAASGRSFPDGSIGRRRDRRKRRKRKEAASEAPIPRAVRAETLRQKCAELDARLQQLEKHVTSRRFQIDQELSQLR